MECHVPNRVNSVLEVCQWTGGEWPLRLYIRPREFSHPNNGISPAPKGLAVYKDALLTFQVSLRRRHRLRNAENVNTSKGGGGYIFDVWIEVCPGCALSVSAFFGQGEGGGGGGGRGELRVQRGAGRGGDGAPDSAEHRGVVVGGCITYRTLLQLSIHILILHTLILPATNLDTFICVHFNGMPGSSALTVV